MILTSKKITGGNEVVHLNETKARMFRNVLVPKIDFRLVAKDLLFIHSFEKKIPHTFSVYTYFDITFRPVAQYVIDVSLVMDSDEQPSEIIME